MSRPNGARGLQTRVRPVEYLQKVGHFEKEDGRYTPAFLGISGNTVREVAPCGAHLELGARAYTGARNFGHLTWSVDDASETCRRLQGRQVTINRCPLGSYIAVMESLDRILIRVIQRGGAKTPAKHLALLETGTW